MGIVLARVDDRLLHGQVAHGWGSVLHPGLYVIVDRETAEDDWALEAMAAAAGGETEVVAIAPEIVGSVAGRVSDVPTVVLFRDLGSLRAAAEHGLLEGVEVNLGGLREVPAEVRLLPYLSLSRHSAQQLLELLRGGMPLFAQDLPSSKRYDARWLISRLEDLLAGAAGTGKSE